MGSPSQPQGPDLTQGVPLSDLKEGTPFPGRVGDEAVILVRRGAELFAVGGTCTHYSGPLADGIVVGETVRCPWHHACFDLRTGEAVRAPALNPIACYQVLQSDGVARVGAKLVPPPRAPRAGAPTAIVIVGAGAAGNAAAEALRREGYDGALTLIGREDDVPYDRPNLSKDYLAGTAPEAWIPLRGEEFYREQRIELVRGVRAQTLNLATHTVRLSDGRALPWDRLLLATGADAVPLAVPGASEPHVRTLRSLADSRAIVAAATPGTRAVVVGASFIAMEVAAALRARKVEVHVVAPDACPFERTLGLSVGDFLRNVHIEQGVVFHLGDSVARIDGHAVTLGGGERLHADLVVVGIGVRPALDLATGAGLAVDRGVVVDRYLQTSAPGVFAAGDVARWPEPRSGAPIRIEHWVVAERMGQTAARNMLGGRQAFAAVPFFWTSQYDVTLCYVGRAERWDQIELDGSLDARDCALGYRLDGKIIAVVTIGRDRVSLEAEAAFERGDEPRLSI